jgi:hypothetical protein
MNYARVRLGVPALAPGELGLRRHEFAAERLREDGLPRDLRYLEPLPLLLALNQKCAAAEREGRTVAGPGLPAFWAGDGRFLSDD